MKLIVGKNLSVGKMRESEERWENQREDERTRGKMREPEERIPAENCRKKIVNDYASDYTPLLINR